MPEVQIFGEFAGYTLNDLIRKTLTLCYQRVVKDADGNVIGDFSRFSRDDIVEALNEAIEELVLKAQLAQTFAIIRLRAKVREYPLPRDLWMLQHCYYVDSNGVPISLAIHSYRYLNEVVPYLRSPESGGIPQTVYLADSYGNIRKLGVYPVPAEDGKAVSFSGYAGVVTSGNLGDFVGELTGTHNGANNSASLVDSTRNFASLGVKVGMMVFNASKDAGAQITGIATTVNPNDTLVGTLSGGADWDSGDSYVVPTGEYGEIVQIDNSEIYIFSSVYGGISNIKVPGGNLLIQYYRYPGRLSDNSHYPEVYKYFQKALPRGAAKELLASVAARSDMKQQAMQYAMEFQEYINEARRYELAKHVRPRSLRMRPVR